VRFSALLPALILLIAGSAAAENGSAAENPAHVPDLGWDQSAAVFDAADRTHAPPPGGVLFVGSSSIRLWDNLQKDFASLPVVINRGFGGSKLSDCVRHLDRLVLPYRPRLVLVYAGDNDLAVGRTADDILARFKAFIEGVRAKLPQTRIAFISIKPSPARAWLLAEIRRANALVRDYAASQPNTDFIDVFNPMLGADGRPRAELFRQDALHLNAKGYELWRAVIAPYVS
jgi:lysophospholipase L1-like esterase